MGRILIDDYNGRVAKEQDVMGTILPNCGSSAPRNGYKIIEYFDAYNGIARKGLAGTITTRVDRSNKTFIIESMMDIQKERAILTQERTEYAKMIRDGYERGCIHARRSELKNLVPRKDGVSNTLTSVQKDNLLMEKKILSYTRGPRGEVVDRHVRDIAGTGHTKEGSCGNTAMLVCEPRILQRPRGENRGGVHDILPTMDSSSFADNNLLLKDFRVRKLTPRECFRLMDVADADIEKIQAAGVSKSQQYRMAGNSIVVSVLFHIFRKMFVDTGSDNEELELF